MSKKEELIEKRNIEKFSKLLNKVMGYDYGYLLKAMGLTSPEVEVAAISHLQ